RARRGVRRDPRVRVADLFAHEGIVPGLMRCRAALPLLLLTPCTCQRDATAPAPIEVDAAQHRVREVIGAPVRAYPPHAIRSDGIGPYLLDQPLGDVLRKLPEGLNLEVLQIGRYASWLVVSAETGQILLGAPLQGPPRLIPPP